MKNKYVIIVAGGVGSRMESKVPKQFIEVNGKPIIFHTIEKFHQAIEEINIILVLHPDYIDYYKELVSNHNFNIPCTIANGGVTRYHSSLNGIELVSNDSIVAIHDAARPLISAKHIQDLFDAAEVSEFVVPVVDVKESLRLIDDSSSNVVNRSKYKVVQTPQVFRSELLKESYSKGYKNLYTDDASVVQTESGRTPTLIIGEEQNIKITTPVDIVIAQYILGEEKN